MANENYPNKPLAPWIPRSQRDSGMNLDENFPEIETSSANAVMGVDEVFAPVHLGNSSKAIGTEFSVATTNHNPEPTLPLMTSKSAAQAKKAAPRNAYKTNLEE